ncbi:hypothetical protein [Altererythrobacter sp. MF3-039]|uniref:hypothetical protein n=1 Tax=Altererythrobacter sp. MF3-039 TaxID=3252901 RepID=UPI00390CC7E6
MSKHFERELVADRAVVYSRMPADTRHEVDRTFEIPPIAYALTVGSYLGFLAILTAAVGNSELIIPMVIFSFFIVAGFSLPTIWTRLEPEKTSKALSWGRFRQQGILTHTGHVTAGEAMAQVLILPVLVFFWGLAIAVILALI